jgi:PadR family transcriptional regulator PadR
MAPRDRGIPTGGSTDIVRGTLDLLILKTLSLAPMLGWAIAQRLQQLSEDALRVGQGSLYPPLKRMEEKGWVESEWRATDQNRRAEYYELTAAGRRALGRRRRAGVGMWRWWMSSFTQPEARTMGDRANRWRRRIRALVCADVVDRELDEEIAFHLEQEVEQKSARGCLARMRGGRAELAFGGREKFKEGVRAPPDVRLAQRAVARPEVVHADDSETSGAHAGRRRKLGRDRPLRSAATGAERIRLRLSGSAAKLGLRLAGRDRSGHAARHLP